MAQDVLDTDGEQFDCEACPLAAAQAELWPENADAWRIFERIGRRFVADFDLGPFVVKHCLDGREADDVLDIVDRLTVIYDVIAPPKES